MSDSDSDLSQASQELNEVVQPKVTDDLLKPPAPSYTSAFDLDGKSYRSVGVLCTPELALEAIKEFEAKTKIDRFASLPDNVVKQIIAWTLSVEVDKAEQSAKEADWTDCGRVRSTKLAAIEDLKRAKHNVLRRLAVVSRRFYHQIRPQLWRKLDLSSYSNRTYCSLTALNRSIPSKTSVRLPASKSDTKADNASPANQSGANDATTGAEGDSARSPPTKRRKKMVSAVKLPVVQSLPTFGELVETLVIGSLASCMSDCVTTHLKNLPNLKHIFFPIQTNLSQHLLQTFVTKATYSLRTVDHLFFATNGEDNESRVEAILSLFNSAPNIERFGVAGQFILDELRGKRLAFVWKLNARFKHSPSGCLGIGLKQLYFGDGVEMTVGFLRSLKESCPRLEKLHIARGVKVTIDSTPQGGTPFDLAAFATQWDSLKALALVGTDTFSTSGALDTILKVNAAVTHLHLRSDHISYAFFASIVNDCGQALLVPIGPPHEKVSTHQLGSDNRSSAILVAASKRRYQGTGLSHPLENLAITMRLGEIGGSSTSLQIPGCWILSFSLLVLSFQARGLEWPTEMGGQRDLLSRAALMINLQIDMRFKEEKARAEKAKTLQSSDATTGKGQGKDVGNNTGTVVSHAGQSKVIIEIMNEVDDAL